MKTAPNRALWPLLAVMSLIPSFAPLSAQTPSDDPGARPPGYVPPPHAWPVPFAPSAPDAPALTSIPGAWLPQGPGPISGGQVEGMVNKFVCGAIHCVIAHPTNPDIVYIGAVNGGVWKTTNATAANPTWTTTMAGATSASIGALTFDPLDATNETVWAGIGRFGSFYRYGGSRSGLLKTTDGGATWVEITGGGTLVGKNISGMVVRGNTVVVSVNTADSGGNPAAGVWRSTDGGTSFTRLTLGDGSGATGLPEGVSYDVVSSPATPNTLYTNVALTTTSAAKGIFKSTDQGATWSRVSTPLIEGRMTASVSNIEMSVGEANNVFFGILESGAPVGLFGSTDGGATWQTMDLPTMPIVSATLSTVTNATNATPIVITTAAAHGLSTNNYVEIEGVVGNTAANGIFQITVTSTTSFSLDFSSGNGAYVSGGTASRVTSMNPRGVKGPEEGTPEEIAGGQGSIHFSILAHPTNANLVFTGGDRQDLPFPNYLGAVDYSGNLWRGDLSLAPNGASPSSQWKHLTHSNAVAGIPGGGTADSSSPHADSRDMAMTAGGVLIEVDDGGIFRRTNPLNNTGAWTSMAGNLQVTEAHSITYDTVSNIIITGNQDNGTSFQNAADGTAYSAVSTADGGDVSSAPNPSNPAQSIRYSSNQNLGGFRRRTYSSTNTLVSSVTPALSPLSGAPALTGQFTTPVEINVRNANRLLIGAGNGVYESLDQGATVSRISTLSPNDGGFGGRTMIYGGRKNGADNLDVVYFADGSSIYRRVTAGATPAAAAGYTGSTVMGVMVDPEDYDHVFAIDNNQIFRSTDGGASFTDITGDIPASVRDFRSLEFVRSGAEWAVVLGTLRGVYAARYNAVNDWAPVGTDMPNVYAWDMDYDAADDVLVVGTLGRGVWKFNSASSIAEDPSAAPEIVVEQPAGTGLTDGVATVDFGTLSVGSGQTRTFTIRNDGVVNLNISSITKDGTHNTEVTLGAVSSSTLVPGATATFDVTFTPGGLGSRTAAIHVLSNDTDEASFDIALTVTGSNAFPEIAIEQPAGTVRPDSAAVIDFGATLLGVPEVRTFTINNTGSADLVLSGVTVDGAGASSFIAGTPSSMLIPAAGSATLSVSFAPSASGAAIAALHVLSNDTDEASYDVELHGIGTIQPGPVGLTRDIAPLPAGGSFTTFLASGANYYYNYGSIIMRTNGTEAGTTQVGTLSIGTTSMALAGTTLVYSGNDTTAGNELWTYNGTTAARLVDINTGTANSSPANFTTVGSLVYFTATTAASGLELWKTDGTAVGTVMVKEINASTASSTPANLTNVGGTLFFSATDGTNGIELWKSDGTSTGTVLVSNINAGSANSNPASLTAIGSTVYFSASNGTTTGLNGTELWKSDGTTTTMVLDISAGTASSSPAVLYNAGGTLYFRANTAAAGVELWKSDGTSGGTALVKDIFTGISSSTPANFMLVGSTLFFTAGDSSANGTELWKTDGTNAGTVMVANINALANSSSTPSVLTAVGSTLYFSATDGVSGAELWKSDGTALGTVRVEDIQVGATGSGITAAANLSGVLLFGANDGVTGVELWRSDGTASGTFRVRDHTAGSASSSATNLTVMGLEVIFTASDGITGLELWKTDGSLAGTVQVKDIIPGSGIGFPSNLTLAGTTLFFSALDSNGTELWKSDATTAGTLLVRDINAGTANSSPTLLRAAGSSIFFAATGSTAAGQELWRSDGTSGGTVLVKNINPTANTSSGISSPVVVGGTTLYFQANDGTNGLELWTSDGTNAGTVMVKDINPGAANSSPSTLTIVGSTVYFAATDGTNGSELWKTDGTSGGTVMVKDIRPGSTGSGVSNFFAYNGALYFQANDGTNGSELWTSDGTTVGTVMLKDINPGTANAAVGNFAIHGGILYFSATDSFGTELWKTDGAPAGTVQVRDINPGSSSSSPANLTSVGSLLYFSATTAANGTELWRTDGTSAGTQLVADLVAGTTSSSPAFLRTTASRLFFVAGVTGIGTEVFSLDLSSTPEIAVHEGSSIGGLERQDNTGLFQFGSQVAPASTSFTIRNTGTGLLYISGITLSGPEAGSFSLQNVPNASLPVQPDATVTFGVTATLEGPPVQNAVVSIQCNDADEASFEIPITVTVVDSTPPVITAPATWLIGQAGALTVPLPDLSGIVIYQDNLPGEGDVTQSPLPGAVSVAIGQEVSVSFTAEDASGNVSNTVTTLVKAGIGQPNTGALAWASAGSGVGTEGTVSRSVATADGGAVVAGAFGSSPFVLGTGPEAVTLTSAGANDVFVAKFAKDGSLEWARSGGGTTTDAVSGILELADGSIVVAGTFSASATFSGTTISGGTGTDTFLLRYTSNGTLSWAKGWGGTGTDSITQLVLLGDGNLAVAGSYTTTATITLVTGVTLANTNAAGTDLFLAKYQASDGTALWARSFGSATSESSTGLSLAATPDGGVVMAGILSSATMTITGTANTIVNQGAAASSDWFAAKFTSAGASSWAKNVAGGTGTENPSVLGVFSNGDLAIAGTFASGTTTLGIGGASPVVFTPVVTGTADVAVARISGSTGNLAWARRVAGLGVDSASALRVLPDNSLVLAGLYAGGSVQLGIGEARATTLTAPTANNKLYLARFSGTDGSLRWAKSTGGLAADSVTGLALLGEGLGVAGTYGTPSGIFGPGEPNQTSFTNLGTGADAFVAKHSLDDGSLVWAKRGGGANVEAVHAFAALSNGSAVLVGTFQPASATFGAGEGGEVTILNADTAGTNTDYFITRFHGGGVEAPVAPIVELLPASGLSPTSLTFNASIDSRGQNTTVEIDYGPTTGYGTTVTATAVNAGLTPETRSLSLTSLAPLSTLNFRVRATNAAGTTTSANQAITTFSDAEIEVEQPVGNGLVDGSATVSFGTVALGASVDRIFTIRNSGTTGTLTGLAVTKDGTAAVDYTLGTLGATSLLPGESTTFTVTYAPAAGGTRNAAIHIASSDGDENPFDITLTGDNFFNATFASAGTIPVTSNGFSIPTGRSLGLNLSFAPAAGAMLTVISNTGSTPINGTFTDLPDGGIITAVFGGQTYLFHANYQGGDGNDLVLIRSYDWTWVKGTTVINSFAVNGTQGTANIANTPGGRSATMTWTDAAGNLWLFGGFNSSGTYNNDLWRFDRATAQWTWVKGSNTANQVGTYGIQGTANAANTPGSRQGGYTWIDSSGMLWLFGGFGFPSSGTTAGQLNDLWKYDPAINNWTWVKGSAVINSNGTYGSQLTPAAGNTPGGRQQGCAWLDTLGRLWLFGGSGLPATGTVAGNLNDLWQFDPTTGNWTWMKGNNTTAVSGTYGTLGVANFTNLPGSRVGAASWTDDQGRFWLFGGNGSGSGLSGTLGDLWRFDSNNLMWTWMSGAGTPAQQNGIYGIQGRPAPGNIPGYRQDATAWRDMRGRLWLFGGSGRGAQSATVAQLSDLWYYDIALNQWAWVKGPQTLQNNGIYGTQGTPAAANLPGARQQATSWATNGPVRDLLMYGGFGFPATGASVGRLSDVWMLDLPDLPSVTTRPASVAFVSATLNAYATPADIPTTMRFRYGTSPVLADGVLTPPVTVTTVNQEVSESIGGLLPSTTYYFRAEATSAAGTVNGSILSYTTDAAPDIVIEVPPGTSLVSGVSTVDIGSVVTAQTVSRQFTVRNIGNLSLTGITFELNGSHPSEFAVTGLPSTLVAGASTTFTVSFTAGASGNRSADLFILNNDPDEFNFLIGLTATAYPVAYQNWSTSNGLNGTNNGPNQDPDGDGLTNLQEFGYGLNPTTSSSGALVLTGGTLIQRGTPIPRVEAQTFGVNYQAAYVRNQDAVSAGYTYTVQFSGDLNNWFNSSSTPTVQATDGNVQAVTVPYPFLLPNRQKARFFRVTVSPPP
ncbi:MAG: choice-of-anchor D domain-containing protein [Verrucomicrobiaceae bacterium]|nr:choice-of-anchor D domain-containing protein [Verrucomicrobiaceae bacterium]